MWDTFWGLKLPDCCGEHLKEEDIVADCEISYADEPLEIDSPIESTATFDHRYGDTLAGNPKRLGSLSLSDSSVHSTQTTATELNWELGSSMSDFYNHGHVERMSETDTTLSTRFVLPNTITAVQNSEKLYNAVNTVPANVTKMMASNAATSKRRSFSSMVKTSSLWTPVKDCGDAISTKKLQKQKQTPSKEVAHSTYKPVVVSSRLARHVSPRMSPSTDASPTQMLLHGSVERTMWPCIGAHACYQPHYPRSISPHHDHIKRSPPSLQSSPNDSSSTANSSRNSIHDSRENHSLVRTLFSTPSAETANEVSHPLPSNNHKMLDPHQFQIQPTVSPVKKTIPVQTTIKSVNRSQKLSFLNQRQPWKG